MQLRTKSEAELRYDLEKYGISLDKNTTKFKLVAAMTKELRKETNWQIESQRATGELERLREQLIQAALHPSAQTQSQTAKLVKEEFKRRAHKTSVRLNGDAELARGLQYKIADFAHYRREQRTGQRARQKLEETLQSELELKKTFSEMTMEEQRQHLWSTTVEPKINRQMEEGGRKWMTVTLAELEGNALAKQMDALAAEVKERREFLKLLQSLKDDRLYTFFTESSIKHIRGALKPRCTVKNLHTTSYGLRIRLIKEHRKCALTEEEMTKTEAQIKSDGQKARSDAEKAVAGEMLKELTAVNGIKSDDAADDIGQGNEPAPEQKSSKADAAEGQRADIKEAVNLRRGQLLATTVKATQGWYSVRVGAEELLQAKMEYDKAMSGAKTKADRGSAVAKLRDFVHKLLHGSHEPAPQSAMASVVGAVGTAFVVGLSSLIGGHSGAGDRADNSEKKLEPEPETEPKTALVADQIKFSAALARLDAFLTVETFKNESNRGLEKLLSAMPEKECQEKLKEFVSRAEAKKDATLKGCKKLENESAEMPLDETKEKLEKLKKELHIDFPELRGAQELYRKHLRGHQSNIARMSATKYVKVLGKILRRALTDNEIRMANDSLESDKTALKKAIAHGFAAVRRQARDRIQSRRDGLVNQSAESAKKLKLVQAFGWWRLGRIKIIVENEGTIKARKAKEQVESQIKVVTELRRENDFIEASAEACEKELQDIEEKELLGFEQQCYRHLRNMLNICRTKPTAQVFPLRAGRLLCDVDKKLSNQIVREFVLPHVELTDMMTLNEITAIVRSTDEKYFQPNVIICDAIGRMLQVLNRYVADSDVQEFEIRWYFRSHYAMEKLQVDGLLLWMCTHISEIQTHASTASSYPAVMDVAVHLWIERLGEETGQTIRIRKGNCVPPKRESSNLGVLPLTLFGIIRPMDDLEGSDQRVVHDVIRASPTDIICALIVHEFIVSPSRVRAAMEKNLSIEEISQKETFGTSEADKLKQFEKQKKKIELKKAGKVFNPAAPTGLTTEDVQKENKQKASRVNKLNLALGHEFSGIRIAIDEMNKESKIVEKKLRKLKNEESRGVIMDPVKQKEMEEVETRKSELQDAKRWCCKKPNPWGGPEKRCQHVECLSLGDLLDTISLGDHIGLATAGLIRNKLQALRVTSVHVERYAAEYYGLDATEIDAILLDACAAAEVDKNEVDEMDGFVDDAVSAYGRRSGTKFVKATFDGAEMSNSSVVQYDALSVLKTICAEHFPNLSFDSISGDVRVKTLIDPDQHGTDEQDVAASLVESMVLIACNERNRNCIDSDDEMMWNLLQFVLRVPLYSQQKIMSCRGSDRFVPLQVNADNLTPANLNTFGTACNESFVSFAVKKRNARLLQTLCEFGGGHSLVLADLHASLMGLERLIENQDVEQWEHLDFQAVSIVRTMLGAYPRPREAIHAMMNVPLPTLDDSSAMDYVRSDRFSLVLFGSFSESDVLLQAEFVNAASKFVIGDDSHLLPTPFSFCRTSTIQVLIEKFWPSRKDRPKVGEWVQDEWVPEKPSGSTLLLVQKDTSKRGDLSMQLFSGAEIFTKLRSIVKNHSEVGSEWTPHVQQLMDAGSFELFYEYLAANASMLTESHSSLVLDDCRGLNGSTLAHFAAASSYADFGDLFHRSSPHACDTTGFTPLHIAAKFGRLQHIDAILDGASQNATHTDIADLRTPKHGLSALHLAAKFGHTECVKRLLLMHQNVDVDSLIARNGRTALQLAVLLSPDPEQTRERDWERTVDVLIQAGAEPLHLNPSGESALSLALMCTGVSTTMLAGCLDTMIADDPHAARTLAVHGLVHDCTELSIKVGGTVDVLLSESYRRLARILKLGADANTTLPPHVDVTERSPLHCARSAAVAKLLRDHEANVHRKCGVTKETSLHAVVSSTVISEEQKVEACRELLDGFAEYKNGALNSSLKSPLDVASDLGLMQLVRLFNDEESRRIVNYEQMQLDLQRKSEINLSAVDARLAESDEAKRAAISENIDKLVQQIKSNKDCIVGNKQKAALAPNDHRLNASGGFAFDDQPFEVFLTSRAADHLFSVDQDTAHLVLLALFELAQTNQSTRMVTDETTPQNFKIFTAKVAENAWLVGERAAVYSTRVRQFTDCFRIWEICRDDSLVMAAKDSLMSSLQNGAASRLSTNLTPIMRVTGTPTLYELSDKVGPDKCRHVPMAEPGAEQTGQSIVKLHQLSTFMTKSVMAPNASSITAREHPCHLAMKEAEIMLKVQKQGSSCLLLGRSGTGKTTLLSSHLFSEYCSKAMQPSARQVVGPEQGAAFNQIFVTRNAVLVNCVRKSFRDMCQGSATLPDLPELDGDGKDTGSPYFFDRRVFLEFVDSHLQTSYFEADQTWSRSEGDIESLELQLAKQRLRAHRQQQHDLVNAPGKDKASRKEAEHALELIDDELRNMDSVAPTKVNELSKISSSRGKCIDFDYFRTHMWSRLETTSKTSASAVWTEIVSHITGSTEALRSGGALCEEQYLNLSTKTSATFRPDAEDTDSLSRKYVYTIYTKYQALKKKLGCWDEADLVSHIYRHLSEDGWAGPRIHSLSADEIQDFTQAECWIMVNICADGNSLFLCGDTAQTISRVGFRFQDLKNVFHDRQQAEARVRKPPSWPKSWANFSPS
jgi:ankyrin repeat protein